MFTGSSPLCIIVLTILTDSHSKDNTYTRAASKPNRGNSIPSLINISYGVISNPNQFLFVLIFYLEEEDNLLLIHVRLPLVVHVAMIYSWLKALSFKPWLTANFKPIFQLKKTK